MLWGLNMIRLEGHANGKIVICDTLKKFAPVLNKGDMRDILYMYLGSSPLRAALSSCWAIAISIDR